MERTNVALTTNLDLKIATSRPIALRNRGSVHGPIVRLVSPGDIGELIKPFVFLDRFDVPPTDTADVEAALVNRYHPHSGIMTVTTLFSGELVYEDTTGRHGVLPPGGIEYLQASGGVWHTGSAIGSENAKGFQLWVALPPALESAKATSTYLPRPEVPTEGPVRVILGAYGTAHSRIVPTLPMTYLHVSLKDGEGWRYQPPVDHDVAWVAVQQGEVKIGGVTVNKEIAVFEEGDQAIEFIARGTTDFVLGSAIKHPHSLVLGYYSVHTNSESLKAGESEIKRIGSSVRSYQSASKTRSGKV
jgi:redox-sensitive bicupin YhaK (pirin superfamily)